jgi:type I restriction enzyme S subunit
MTRILGNNLEINALTSLRDVLLPKLLNGDLSAPIAEETPAIVIQLPVTTPAAKPKKANEEFVEAIVIAQIVRALAKDQYPLGRKRYNKLSYLAHRKAEDDVTRHYLKKAAGPYSPWAKYSGPERIAKQNGYVRQVKSGIYEGLIVGPNIEKIDSYLSHYPVCAAIDWVTKKFERRTNDDLELLATVDFASIDLQQKYIEISLASVKDIILENKEWAPKLNRKVFSDKNISRALTELGELFPGAYANE